MARTLPPAAVESAAGASARSRPWLVLFALPRSGRARRVEGFLAQVLQRRRNHETFRLLRVDASGRGDLIARLRLERLPALVVIEGKRVRARLEGPEGVRDIEKLLHPWPR